MAAPPRPIERLARLGIVAKAIVYIVIGLLATGAALRIGGELTDSTGVFYFLLHQPLGRGLLAGLAFGLAAYTLWLFVQAFLDPDRNGTSPIGLINRFGQLVTGLAHAAISYEAVRLALGMGGGLGGGNEALVARGLDAPHGVWLVRLAGLVIVVVAVIQVVRAVVGNVRRDRHLHGLQEDAGRWVVWLGRFGLAARGIVLGVGGWLVLRAANAYDPERAGGIADVLETLRRQFSSGWMLGLVAVGLVAYGVFQLIEARYRIIPAS